MKKSVALLLTVILVATVATVAVGQTLEELLSQVGEDYADNLKDGDSIRYAWRDGVSDWYHAQDATVLTTGYTLSECKSRRSGMKWTNYGSYPRRRNGDVNWYCWTWWNNL